jgi:sugar (pentulose or hexulose) kinase
MIYRNIIHAADIMTDNAPNAQKTPRGIAVVDVGFTNSKVILYDHNLTVIAERKALSPHHDGAHYREIDVDHVLAFARQALKELDDILPVDAIVPCAHGACIVCLKDDGTLALPVMDYMSEPPPALIAEYQRLMPDFAESYSPLLPMALLHAVQLFWQSRIFPTEFSNIKTILPLMQYVGFGLGGDRVTEISSLSCQSHLINMRDGGPSSLSRTQGWDTLFAPLTPAWRVTGHHEGLRGDGRILAGVHDSNANYLRYIAAGFSHFTLLSTGTWIIGFDTDADMRSLDHARDIVANKDVFGRTVACCRFFGGKEYEVLTKGASGDASLTLVSQLIAQQTFALPSFTDSGGPMPATGGKGRIIGPQPQTSEDFASLGALYCALMVSESLDALASKHDVIVDGPFSQNEVFLAVLATLRPRQRLFASEARDGTAAGAACLALMPDGKPPKIPVALREIAPAVLPGLATYQQEWKAQA